MERIKNWLRRVEGNLQHFLYGRYGYDELTQFLSTAAVVCIVVGLFVWPGFFFCLSLAMYIAAMFRMCSKNIAKRQRERTAYLRMTKPLRDWFALSKRRFSERKTHRYYKCSGCKASLRVPKGKGKIKVRCPKCGREFIKKT